MEKINCIICGIYNDKSITEIKLCNANDIFKLTKCINCDFVYLNPRPNESAIVKYYTKDYHPFKLPNTILYDYVYSFIQNITFYWKRRILTKYNKSCLRLLDLGSGNNKFINYMNQNGWECNSYDKFSNHPTLHSLKSIKDKSYNNITLWHSIEHIHDINDLMIDIKRILISDGYIYIACPNYKAIERKYLKENWPAYDIPRHLYHFSYNSLQILLDKYDIKIVNSYRMYQDILFNILISKNTNFIKKIILCIYSFLAVMVDKNKASSILYICKIKNT